MWNREDNKLCVFYHQCLRTNYHRCITLSYCVLVERAITPSQYNDLSHMCGVSKSFFFCMHHIIKNFWISKNNMEVTITKFLCFHISCDYLLLLLVLYSSKKNIHKTVISTMTHNFVTFLLFYPIFEIIFSIYSIFKKKLRVPYFSVSARPMDGRVREGCIWVVGTRPMVGRVL